MGDTRPRRLEEYLLREAALILLLLVLALVQTTLLPTPLGFPPPLMLVLVVCRVLVAVAAAAPGYEIARGMRWAFYGGIALDLCAATPVGSHALALLLAALLVALFSVRLQVGGALLPLVAVLVGTLAYEMVLALIYHLTMATLDWQQHVLVILLPSMLLALIATLPVFHLLRWRLYR